MLKIHYNDSTIHPEVHDSALDSGPLNPESPRVLTDDEIRKLKCNFHLNTSIETTESYYILRAFKATLNGQEFTLLNDVKFVFPGSSTSGWLLSNDKFELSLLVARDDIIHKLTSDVSLRNNFNKLHGQLVCRLFQSITGFKPIDGPQHDEELRIDMNRMIILGELKANEASFNPTSSLTDAIQEENSSLLQEVRSIITKQKNPDISNKRWEELDTYEKEYAFKKLAEKLGIVSS